MALPLPFYFGVAPAPLSKPVLGLGINQAHHFAKGLVHSYPFNEMRGDMVKDWAWPAGQFDLSWGGYAKVQGAGTVPMQWRTVDKVDGLYEVASGNRRLPGHPFLAGFGGFDGRLPTINLRRGFTVHVWASQRVNSLAQVWFSWQGITDGAAGSGMDLVFSCSTTLGNYRVQAAIGGVTNTLFPGPNGYGSDIAGVPNEFVITVAPAPFGVNFLTRIIDVFGNQNGAFAASVDKIREGGIAWPNFAEDAAFEGVYYALQMWDYPMAYDEAMILMRNPLQMYSVYATEVTVDLPPGSPGGSDPGGGSDGGGLVGEVEICSQL